MSGAESILEEALAIVGNRDDTHGEPVENHQRIAALWSAYLGTDITAEEVAGAMVLVKLARTQSGGYDRDHYVDVAGYAEIADQCHGGDLGGDA